MIEETIIVKEWIDDAKEELDTYISDAIKNKKKIHIGAPVGTGKTSYAINIIKEYQDEYQFVILEPLKSITTQLYIALDKKDIDAFEYNGDKRDELEEWEERFDKKWTDTYLSTIDSAWRLFEEDKLDAEKTIIIIDESHTLIQEGRKDFDRSVNAIIDSGCPVIGFSATVSSWVINYLFKIDIKISITASDIPDKEIYQFIETKIPKVIAYEIQDQDYKKVVIWTETFALQDSIHDAVIELLPSVKVVKLNSRERETTESLSWKHIMEHNELPPGTNIAIINKVAQAGININDDDIDQVMLVDKFDPFGFQQYLGRTRKYVGDYYYIHYDYGGSKNDWANDDERGNYLDYIQERINKIDDTTVRYQMDIPPGLEDVYTKLPSGKKGYRLNKCMYANKIYSRYRDLHGTNLIKVIEHLDPTLKFYEATITEEIYKRINADEKANERNIKIYVLPNCTITYARDLISIGMFYQSGFKHSDVHKLINESVGDTREAKRKNVLYVPISRTEGLKNTINTAAKANVSIQRLIIAATAYFDSGSDETTMKKILDPDQVTVQRVTQLMDALQYYNHTYKTYHRYIKYVLNKLTPMIVDKAKNRRSNAMWKKQIQNLFKGVRRTLPQELPTQILRYNLITSETKMMDKATGKDKNVLKLKKVIMAYNDYTTENNLYK